MSIVETDARAAEQPSTDESKSSVLQVVSAVAFFGTVTVAMLGWTGFLAWIIFALAGF